VSCTSANVPVPHSAPPREKHAPGVLGRMSAVIEHPETQYAKTAGGVHIAYQVLGDGPLHLVFVPSGGNHVELAWEVGAFARVV
jgi:hypothetical protein